MLTEDRVREIINEAGKVDIKEIARELVLLQKRRANNERKAI